MGGNGGEKGKGAGGCRVDLDTVMPKKSARGLAQSKTAGARTGIHSSRSVLDCACPLALWAANTQDGIAVSADAEYTPAIPSLLSGPRDFLLRRRL